MEKIFKIKESGSSVRTEILAGLTTFMTMAYIIALNPNLLTNFDVGSPLWNGVFLATCIASAIAMFVPRLPLKKRATPSPARAWGHFSIIFCTYIRTPLRKL